MTRTTCATLLAVAAMALPATALAEPEAMPTKAPTPSVPEVVPGLPGPDTPPPVPWVKFLRLVDLNRANAAEVKRLRRTLAHRPSLLEAQQVAAVTFGVPLGELRSTALCESSNNPRARNGQYRGTYQFGGIFEASPYGRAGLSVWSPLASTMAAAYIVARGGRGWSPWECSPHGAFKP